MAGNIELKEWKSRWDLVERRIDEERSGKSDDWRLRQMLKLNVTVRKLRLPSNRDDVEVVRERWRRLREVIGAGK